MDKDLLIIKFKINARGLASRLVRQNWQIDKFYQQLIKRESWTSEEWQKYEQDRLKEFIGYSLKKVPYYRKKYYKKGDLSLDINQFKLLTKEEIRQYKQQFRPVGLRKFICLKGYTSGTTNQPLVLYRDFYSIMLERSMLLRHLHQVRQEKPKKIVAIRGHDLFPARRNHSPYWVYNNMEGRLYLSSFHLSQKTAELYLDELSRFKPEFIFCYPSSIVFLAKAAQDLNYKVDWPLKAVVSSSETFRKVDRALVEKVFGLILDRYGQAERVALLEQCVKGNYHVRRDYSYVEFVKQGDKYEIVGTAFNNKAMPLIRYRTGDYVDKLPKVGCSCGSSLPYVEEIAGRDDDLLYLPDGRVVGRMDVALKKMKGLLEAQIVQDKKGEVRVSYVPLASCKNVELLEKNLNQHLRRRLGNKLTIKYQRVNGIKRRARGKFRSVISHYKPLN